MTTNTLKSETEHLINRLDAIIREQAGERVFENLEQVRSLARSNRHHRDKASLVAKRALLRSITPQTAYQIAHAFSLFFQLVNLCEERARIRHLADNPEPAMSLKWLFRTLKNANVSPKQLQTCLDNVEIEPVLTAHPTETKRRSVMTQVRRLERQWHDPDETLEALWHTEEVRTKRVAPLNEVDNTMYFFERTIFETSAQFQTGFEAALAEHYPTVKIKRPFLTFASWVGGDRDGNPFVTPEISLEAIRRHQTVVREYYDTECLRLMEELTHASMHAPQRDFDLSPREASLFQPFEIHRAKIATLHRRVMDGTIEARELVRELVKIQAALRKQGAHRAASGRIARLISNARVFGFHLVELDFRDHSGKLGTAKEELIDEFQTIRSIQQQLGEQAARRFILSMTRSANDILRLHAVAKRARCEKVDLVPLFETIDDLDRSVSILRELWSDVNYRKHLKSRGNVQEVMVGYSDSNKDGGYLAANWFLHRSQREMAKLADASGIKLRFFHGKGGTIDRGGGASHRSLRAQPHAAHGGRIRITEQGEVISLKYSNPDIARRNLEQLTSAVIASQCLPTSEPDDARLATWETVMEKLAKLSFDFYQELVFRTPEFMEYFWQATPIDLIEHLRLGSRPTRRAKTGDISQLRAIPWVFAWTQSRHLISAWYGVGHALEEFARTEPDGIETLREMYREWPFFQQLLENAETSLAKTELGIASEYAALVKSADVRKKIFGMIEAEYHRSVNIILSVAEQAHLLEDQPVLAESLRRRNPHVDPLNYLQIRFLTKWRSSGESQRTETMRRLLALTVNGIALGMKSTG